MYAGTHPWNRDSREDESPLSVLCARSIFLCAAFEQPDTNIPEAGGAGNGDGRGAGGGGGVKDGTERTD